MAAWLVSSREVGQLIDRARAIDHSRGPQLVPVPFFLTVVFLVHQVLKRQEMRDESRQATTCVAEMERLVVLGQALAKSVDGDWIREATTEHLVIRRPQPMRPAMTSAFRSSHLADRSARLASRRIRR